MFEGVGAGGRSQLVVGRDGRKTRFRWAEEVAVAPVLPQRAQKQGQRGKPEARPNQRDVARRQRDAAPFPSSGRGGFTAAVDSASAAADGPRALRHSFHVRPGVLATFELPEDITAIEIERLCLLLRAVPFTTAHD